MYLYYTYYISVLTLVLLFEEPHFSKKTISEIHPTSPFFRIQPPTLGEENSHHQSVTPPMAAGSNLRFAAMQKGQGVLPTPTTLKRCHGTTEAHRVLGFDKDLGELPWGFNCFNIKIHMTSGVYHVILHICMQIYIAYYV